MAASEHGAAVNRGNRPLSPHLQVYKLPMTATMSILHRITGVGNSLGAILVVWWFVAAATGAEYFDFVNGLMTSWIGNLILIGFAFSVCYHLCTGIRHLFWDAGYGFELDQARKSGFAVIGAAGLLGVGLLLVGYLGSGV